MTFWTDIHGAQRMNPSPTFLQAPPPGQIFVPCSELSQHLPVVWFPDNVSIRLWRYTDIPFSSTMRLTFVFFSEMSQQWMYCDEIDNHSQCSRRTVQWPPDQTAVKLDSFQVWKCNCVNVIRVSMEKSGEENSLLCQEKGPWCVGHVGVVLVVSASLINWEIQTCITVMIKTMAHCFDNNQQRTHTLVQQKWGLHIQRVGPGSFVLMWYWDGLYNMALVLAEWNTEICTRLNFETIWN